MPDSTLLSLPATTTDWTIANAEVLRPGGLVREDLKIAGGRIGCAASAEGGHAASAVFDAGGGLVLPGIVDLHGDAFERSLEPRPGVLFDAAAALKDADQQLVANGITTAFHAVSISWEAGIRSLASARAIIEAMRSSRFLAAVYPHLRWEVFAIDEAEETLSWLEQAEHALFSLNDHLTIYLGMTPPSTKLDRLAARLGASLEETMELLDDQAGRRELAQAARDRVGRAVAALGVPLLAHDECTVEERRRHRALGSTLCEFPMTLDVAEEAKQAGEAIILGAPNVVRGGSQNNAIGAEDAIRAGLCTVLVSDYHYPSIMKAAFRLAGEGTEGLCDAWPLVSRGPALAAGLTDRGEIADGLRADLLVFWPETQDLRAVFVNGRKVLEFGRG